jgi:DNA-binding CsgD family transcriptional regulator
MLDPGYIDRAAVAVVIADDERRCVEADDAACALIGLPREAIVGTRLDEVTGDGRTEAERRWRRMRAEGVAVGTLRLHGPDGVRGVRFIAVADVSPGRHVSIWMPDPERRGWEPLSQREREVVALVAGGATGREVGEALSVTAATVETHIRNAMRRLGARNRSHLVTLAILRHEIDVGGLGA